MPEFCSLLVTLVIPSIWMLETSDDKWEEKNPLYIASTNFSLKIVVQNMLILWTKEKLNISKINTDLS